MKDTHMKGRKKDILVVLVIIAIAGVCFLANHFLFRDAGQVYGEIYLDGELMDTVNLKQDQQFSLPQRPEVVLEVKNGGIAFVQSDCPDKICIHSGYLSHTGQNASCLPNRMTVRIHGRNSAADDPDIVVGAGNFSNSSAADRHEVSG